MSVQSLLMLASAASLVLPGLTVGMSSELQSVLKNTHRGDEYQYPTDFTRGIMPVNSDYWRDIPFYTGLSKGCISTEADVWLYDGTLYVGHDESSLTEERTLESLYINPMLDVLKRQNPQTPFVTTPTKNGVFDTDPSQTLYFFIDAKTSGRETFEAVISALQPLREQGYLTTVKDNRTVNYGAVTVIGTGNTPLDMVASVADRDYFFDAHLDTLDDSENSGITSLISPIASTSFSSAIGAIAMSKADVDLGDLLARVLPTEAKVTIRHVSSAPTPCGALFAAPPGEQAESTFCEDHFLSVSVAPDEPNGSEIIVFGMEVPVYSTTHLTTIFVSKADSTGYLHLLKLPPRASLLRRISSAFLSYLVQTRQRPGVRLVVSLFARAQNQYLFPGSIENPDKHVLDDRGLIKWWCRTLDPILREYEPESGSQEKGAADQAAESAKSSATAFLIVPGCDQFETRGFFPVTAKSDNKERPRWLNSYPVRQLCDNPNAPPRCLIPRFPDDPKTRFLIDLDDELPEQTESGVSTENAGQWRSVKSLEQFWEMMSFRQECSAGRLVGFLWLVINPPGLVNSVQMTSSRPVPEGVPSEAPSASQKATDSKAFFWPDAGRGHAVLSGEDYKTAINFLLEQDFDNQESATSSTKAWAEKIASLADQLWVGQQVVGSNASPESAHQPGTTTNLMDSGLIRKRKKGSGEGDKGAGSHPGTDAQTVEPEASSAEQSGVNVLQANLIRKKKKT
ncbi:histone acetylation protein-domain-containing protein [Aspergillus ambiguus]|uniref:H3 histone acetyltransferase RTT109 n=1 Tax=Aspergillus ambiguus TaxID=176160 RepID=UPI003CCD72B5